MSSSFFLREKIHLSVNKFSFGTPDHYSKVISIFLSQQGKERLIETEKVFFYDNINFDCRFLIHGWGNDADSFFNIDATEAYLRNRDFNVIVFATEFACYLSWEVKLLFTELTGHLEHKP